MTLGDRCRPDLSEGASSAWLTLHEAAAYLRMTASGIRSLISRAEIVPDGRGSRRIAMFRRVTLDAFLERRAAEYARGRHAVSGVGGTDAKDQVPRRSSALWREVPRSVRGAGPED